MSENSSENNLIGKEELNGYIETTVNQSSAIFLAKIVGLFLGFVFNFVFARFYGAEILGQYSIVNNTINIIVIFTLFGFNNGLTKYIARYNKMNEPEKITDIIKTATKYVVITTVSGASVFFFASNFIANRIYNDPALELPLAVGSILILLITYKRFFDGIFRGFKQVHLYIFAKHVYLKIGYVLAVLLVYLFLKPDIIYIVLSLIILNFIMIGYVIFQSQKLNFDIPNKLIHFYDKTGSLGKNEKNQFIKFSATLIFISFTGLLVGRVDRVMLGIFMTSETVGIYEISAKVASIVLFLLTSTNMIFSSVISELYSANKIEMLESIFSTITKWIILLTLPLALNIIVFSENILLFFGTEYIKGTTTLVLLVIGQFINISVGASGYMLNMSGYERIELFNNIFLGILNVIFNIIFILNFGLVGAAMATASAIALQNIFKLIQIKYFLGIIPYNKNYYPVILNLILIITIALAANNFYPHLVTFIISTGISTFFSLLIIYKLRDENDQFIINIFINKTKNIISNIK